MNRHVKLVLWVAVAVMVATAIAAIAWRAQIPASLAAQLRPRPLAPFILLAVPLILAGTLVISVRNLDARIPGVSEDNTRHVEGAMVFLFLFVAACQAWMAFMYVGAILPGGDTIIRGAVVLLGVAMAVRGNFVAKLSPPAVQVPPDPAVWGRMARRMGRALVAIGSLLTVCALVLPPRPLVVVMMALTVLLLGMSWAHRKAMKRAQTS